MAFDLFGQKSRMDRRYYLVDFMCETPPCDCTLGGWASYLAGQGDDRPNALASDGQQFQARRSEYAWIGAVFESGNWVVSEPPEGFVYHAIAYGPEMGWSPEMIVEGERHLLEVLEGYEEGGGVIPIAVRCAEDVKGVVTFHSGTAPRCVWQGISPEAGARDGV